MFKKPGAFLLIGLAILLSACSISLAEDIIPPPGSELKPPQQVTQTALPASIYPIVPPDLENGAKLYNQECAQCHGPNGLGDGSQATQLSVPVAALGLSDFSRLYTPAEWYSVVTQGNMEKFMPPFGNLTDRQRWDVIAYALSLSISNEVITTGKLIYAENCMTCHGVNGKGDGPEANKLSTELTDLTDQSIMAQRSATHLFQTISSGIAPGMPAYESILGDEERWALVSYIRSLTIPNQEASENAYPLPADNSFSDQSLDAYPAPQTNPEPVETQIPQLTSTTVISSTASFKGTVSVQLINGSGIEAPSDVPVTLYGFDQMQNTYSETLQTGVNGVYAFTNVFMPEGRVFLAGTEYASAPYSSDLVTVDPANPDLKLELTVYNSTTDVSVLTADRVHIFLDFSNPQTVQVMEVFIISNPTNLVVVSPSQDGIVVTFPLPEGYTNLQFQDGELGTRYVEVDQGFADTMPVKPGVGEYQVIFAFQLPYSRNLDFVQTMFLPTSAVVVMSPENSVKVESDQLVDSGTRDINGNTYHMHNGSSLLAGSTLEFTLSGKPKQATSTGISTGTMQNLAIGLGVFGVVLLIVGLWLFRQNRIKTSRQQSAEAAPGETGAQDEGLSENEDTLMDAIIALDDQYRAGNLPEEAYLERRAVLKEKLRIINQGSA
jgi:mono/diheme cytochrome c family protein